MRIHDPAFVSMIDEIMDALFLALSLRCFGASSLKTKQWSLPMPQNNNQSQNQKDQQNKNPNNKPGQNTNANNAPRQNEARDQKDRARQEQR